MTGSLKIVRIYTDGAADPNPGPGGYGVVLIHQGRRKELSGSFRRTTNNRMEIMSAIVGLEGLKEPCEAVVHSDSKYLVDAMSLGWVRRWQANGWRRKKNEMATNIDLWKRLLAACEGHQAQFTWIRGHAGHRENERCDVLSKQFAKMKNLPPDEGYEQREEIDERERAAHPRPDSSNAISFFGSDELDGSTPLTR